MNNLLERIEKALIVESSKANFIMDMDVKDRKLRDVDTGKVIMELPRYAAWGYIDRGKNEVNVQKKDLFFNHVTRSEMKGPVFFFNLTA